MNNNRDRRRAARNFRRWPLLAAPLVAAALLVSAPWLRGQSQTQAQPQTPAPQQATTPAAQQPIKVDVKVVNVLASVRDKKGQIVTNLGQDDFTVEEDGHPQAITYFARDTDMPLTLGLLVDTSESQRMVLDAERNASRTFLEEMLGAKDRAFIIRFDREAELLADVTSSRDRLDKALDKIEPARPQFANQDPNAGSNGGGNNGGNGGGNGGGYGCNGGGGGYPAGGGGYPGGGGGYPGGGYPGGGGGYPGGGGCGGGRGGGGGGGYPRGGGLSPGGGTLLYDSVFLASDEVLKKEQGRKALIVLTDGVDRGSKESLEYAIETAQRADTIVYAIYFTGEEGQNANPFGRFGGGGFGGRGGGGRNPRQEESRPDGKKTLERISKETGGRMFEVTKKQTVGDIYDAIAKELRSQYSIGYTPAAGLGPGYHKIQVSTKQKDLTVQAREGYYNSR